MDDPSKKQTDLARRPLSYLLAWGLPILVLVLANLPVFRGPAAVVMIIAALAWMGTACLINAFRCKRRHCFVSGPIFLLGGLFSGLVGFGIIDFGGYGLMMVVWGSLILGYSTKFLEKIWGKYVE